jgi:23S rRNA pseudouridine2605 synthase
MPAKKRPTGPGKPRPLDSKSNLKSPIRKPRPAAAPKDPTAEKKPYAPRVSKPKVRGADDAERLHVRIARSGICSRRAAEELIKQGRVSVNGEIVGEMGVKVRAEDEVAVDGMPVAVAKTYTVVLYKPLGCVTTMRDPQGRPTIVRYLPDLGVPLKPVGRLDMDTDGLLICTNDGELANRLAHPRYGIEKEYQAIVKGITDEKALNKLRKGIWIEGGKTAPAQVDLIHAEEKTNTTGLRITIHEGRKRQIRLMCEAAGHPIVSLRRIRYGPFRLKGMRAGQARLLGKQEVEDLRKLVGLD